ncbi:ammonia-forming cytochrome c nitrite reductase subunit c552 [Hugonella massiliensis]|uniref:ammonia-forming cytochrome c nitrite reductase subunit c552 n=1 Tax=Hugonella massiliensis TaxID=1720315 RepID=UPI00073EDFAE|nr:ammonia-forming cytochrome c nitrite reductase subunit c552 [Hugonella massiliensis]
MKHKLTKKAVTCMCVLAIGVVSVGVYACAPKANTGVPTPSASSPSYIPEANKYGVITAESWADQYPDQYASYLENNKNTWPEGKANKLELYPEMITLGKGYGYAKFFSEPGGHTSSIYTTTHNGRITEKTKTQCLACKTPNVHYQVAAEGNDVWKTNLYQTVDDYTDGTKDVSQAEGISCANCHENNDPSSLAILRADWKRALGANADKVPESAEVCGQCHCDYSMNAQTGEPTSPYDDVTEMTPDNALQWYDNHNFVDWTYESTGAKMISVRHSEFEYNYGGEGNHMAQLGYTCADCHMATEVDDQGNAYTSHYWISPLDNEELLKNDCNTCHKDLKAEVQAKQDEWKTMTQNAGQRASVYVKNLEKAVAAGSLNDEQLARAQYIQRAATFYWNSSFAENSKGAHNISLFRHVIDQCNTLLDEGDQILGVTSDAKDFQSEYNPDVNTLDFGSDHYYNQQDPETATQDYGTEAAQKYGNQ